MSVKRSQNIDELREGLNPQRIKVYGQGGEYFAEVGGAVLRLQKGVESCVQFEYVDSGKYGVQLVPRIYVQSDLLKGIYENRAILEVVVYHLLRRSDYMREGYADDYARAVRDEQEYVKLHLDAVQKQRYLEMFGESRKEVPPIMDDKVAKGTAETAKKAQEIVRGGPHEYETEKTEKETATRLAFWEMKLKEEGFVAEDGEYVLRGGKKAAKVTMMTWGSATYFRCVFATDVVKDDIIKALREKCGIYLPIEAGIADKVYDNTEFNQVVEACRLFESKAES
jgi:hypothetical protein